MGNPTSRRRDIEPIQDLEMDDQIFRFLAGFTQIKDPYVREQLVASTEWISRHQENARTLLNRLTKH